MKGKLKINNICNKGINLTTSKYTDDTEYNTESYDFDGDNVKFVGKNCVYAKRGIGFKTRGTECSDSLNYYCQWNGNLLQINIKLK